jgi:ferredoxin
VLASGDFTAIDVAACRIMAIDPAAVGTIKAAIERGLIQDNFGDISFVGEGFEKLIVRDFKKPQTYLKPQPKQGRGWHILGNMAKAYALRPEIIKDKCIGCEECERICPRQAIAMKNKKAQISYDKCIRCYSCHETCANDAISLGKSRAGRFITKMME